MASCLAGMGDGAVPWQEFNANGSKCSLKLSEAIVCIMSTMRSWGCLNRIDRINSSALGFFKCNQHRCRFLWLYSTVEVADLDLAEFERTHFGLEPEDQPACGVLSCEAHQSER
eukprot:2304364-Amphidinium_carterae.1